ncbi:hypothetical protein ACNJX9_17555 [Bradyrhizobium sp. DASA03076]|uniref:hypothetical protein n=1 Tax=Bradyrhizobium sp. BLXBL-03 TaxID=3395916 RepID=UPI003F6F35C9
MAHGKRRKDASERVKQPSGHGEIWPLAKSLAMSIAMSIAESLKKLERVKESNPRIQLGRLWLIHGRERLSCKTAVIRIKSYQWVSGVV